KKKIGDSHRGKKRPPFSEKWKKKMSENRKGEKHPNWKGGISKHPDYHSIANKKRAARKSDNGGNFTIGEWELLKKQYGNSCPSCRRKESDISLSIDHIIPISRGGSNSIENIQPLCGSCNSKKHIKIFRITPDGEMMLF
ncbi:MAG: HNH endonuclease signature motif containing protein, partial [Flavobacterium sp.]|nr:HNH endonuclease signature motif containing protein [Flavobacterium sp.]